MNWGWGDLGTYVGHDLYPHLINPRPILYRDHFHTRFRKGWRSYAVASGKQNSCNLIKKAAGYKTLCNTLYTMFIPYSFRQLILQSDENMLQIVISASSPRTSRTSYRSGIRQLQTQRCVKTSITETIRRHTAHKVTVPVEFRRQHNFPHDNTKSIFHSEGQSSRFAVDAELNNIQRSCSLVTF